MNILSWNIRGLGNWRRKCVLKEYVRTLNPNIFIIQESKLDMVN